MTNDIDIWWFLRGTPIEFEDHLFDEDGNPIDLRPFFGTAASSLASVKFDQKKLRPEFRGERLSPRTRFSMSPLPNALANPQGEGYIVIHLGICISLAFLGHLTEAIFRSATKKELSFAELDAIQVTQDCVAEINTLMNSWTQSYASDWHYLKVPSSKGTHFHIERQMISLVVAHELGHWLEAVYTPEAWQELITRTEDHLRTWLEDKQEEQLGSLEEMNYIRQLLAEKEIFDNWTREVCSDLHAYYTTMRSYHGDWDPALRIYTNISMELLFVVLNLLEAFFYWVTQNPLPMTTHPPVHLRCRIFYHAMARERGMSKAEFLAKEWGFGLLTKLLAEKALNKWQEQTQPDPQSV